MLPSSSSRARSRSWGAGPWTAPPLLSPRQMKPRHQRSSSTSSSTYAPLVVSDSEGQPGRGGSVKEPAEEGVREAAATATEEESARARQEQKTTEVSEPDRMSDGGGGGAAARERVRHLEREVASAKQTEMKMLESLVQQTRELEEAKAALEEARQEAAALRQQRDAAAPALAAPQAPQQWSVMGLVFGGVDEEINGLRARLRAAAAGEERSRKAADELTAALSAVTMEAKQVKAWLCEAQAELEAAGAEADRLRGALAGAESRLRAASADRDRCRLDAEAWGDKERSLLACVRASEEEVNRARQDNTKLVESQRVIRDENARLRDILKQAVAEANVVKDSLELARAENARLNDAVAERDAALQSLRQEYECVRVSEAAAQGSLRELNSLLAATTTTATACSTPASAKTAPAPDYERRLPNGGSRSGTPQSVSKRWMQDKPRTPGSRRYSIGEPGKLKGGFSQSARMGSLNPKDKDRVFASLSNIADLKSAANAAMEDDFDDEFDHIDESHYVEMDDAMNHKKKRPILRKFGDLFRRKSFYKPNLAPVHTL